jgi:hypothetical protein
MFVVSRERSRLAQSEKSMLGLHRGKAGGRTPEAAKRVAAV